MSDSPKKSAPSSSNPQEETTTHSPVNRRTFLASAGAGLLATAALGTIPGCTTPPGNSDGGTDGGSDGGPPETRKKPDPQDSVDPQKYDKATKIEKDPGSVKEDSTLFPLAVQSGAMTSNTAWVWSYTTDNKSKKLRIWREDDKKQYWEVTNKELTPKEGYFKVKVESLAPGTWYSYGFFDGDKGRSMVGRFRTALIEGSLQPLTLAGTTCTKYGNMPYKALQVNAEYDYDIFVHLGDFSYNDRATNQSLYRKEWRRALSDPGYKASLSKAGMYLTWDDHEIVNNDKWDSISKERKQAGVEAFFEHTMAERIEGDRFWNSYRWGDTAEIFVLDCRNERIYDTRKTDDPIYISKAQMAWLKKALKDSKAHFKIMLNSVPITDFTGTVMASIAADDRWQGYEKQRTELLQHIVDNKIDNVWWLTGDFHLSSVNRINGKGPFSSMVEIMVGPGGNGNPLWPVYQAQPPQAQKEQFPPSQFYFIGGDFSATLMTFDPHENSVSIKYVHHETKKVLFEKTIQQPKAL